MEKDVISLFEGLSKGPCLLIIYTWANGSDGVKDSRKFRERTR